MPGSVIPGDVIDPTDRYRVDIYRTGERHMRRHTIGYAFGILLAGSPAASTAVRAQDAKTCARAARIVEKGRPDKKEAWAWSMILGCGSDGSTAAKSAWMAQRTLSDTTQLAATFGDLWSFRDSALFGAAERVAVDPSATRQSRVYSVMMLLVLLFDDAYPEYGNFSTKEPKDVCRVGQVFDRVITEGAPLAPDARQRARALARALAADPSAPPEVRSAGSCLDDVFILDDRVRALRPLKPPSV